MSTKENREKHLLSKIFINKPLNQDSQKVAFMCSPNDLGVIRNNGRAGSRFAPKTILSTLKKFNNHLAPNLEIETKDVCSINDLDFDNMQLKQANSIESLLKDNYKSYIHLGGGHDHVSPLLNAIQNSGRYDNIVIINIDAHCDTRVDTLSHSGTPFRDFDKNSKIPFFLFQYGIHFEANNKDTMSPLKRGKMLIEHKQNCTIDVIEKIKKNCHFSISNKTCLLISIDCDGFDSSFMSAVSAVNLDGISLNHYLELQNNLKSLELDTILGIYEYNPMFEDLSLKGSRAVSKIIYEYLK